MESKIFDYDQKNGFVNCANPSSAINNSEILYLNEVKKLNVDAVLFRRFYNDNDTVPYRSEPSVCIFQKDDNFFNSQQHIKLHAALWSAAKNEVYIIISPTRIDIINSRRPAELVDKCELSIENLILASGEVIEDINSQLFSASVFGNGSFWEQSEFENKLDERNSPYIFLLDYLMTVRKIFLTNNSIPLSAETIDKLLVTCILIKFLEEIKDDKGKHTLRSLYSKYNVENFAEIIDKGFIIQILNDLTNEFNGKIFDKFSDNEKTTIEKTNLSLLANFLKANIDIKSGQLFLWEQYSFKHLPAEIISAIYENFIQAEALRKTGDNEKGVVYTPIHLVNLLIDEVMPLNKPHMFLSEKFKVLDPSCGSGVFLVAAYKRLLQWWAINNSTNNIITYPDSKKAQKILEDNIYGVDVKNTATFVTVFGLTTALLDKLTPQEIWNNLEFKDLNQINIQNRNFFEWAIKAKENLMPFDLVIGNPPFNVETGKNKSEVINSSLLRQLDFKHKVIPNNNFALHFFEASMVLAKKVCLIIPSTVLLYNRPAQIYRNKLFTNYTVEKIYDFTHLREVLFTKKNNQAYENQKKMGRTPVVALIVNNIPSDFRSIEHIVVKRTTAVEKKLRFEIDYYDKHQVMWDWAIDENKSFIWKTNLLGGGRLFHLIYRLSLLPNLKDFISIKKDNNSEWIYSSGYKIGGKSTKKTPANFLHLKTTIDTKKKFDKVTNTFSTTIENNFEFEASRKEVLYTPPLLVISEVLGTDMIPMQIFNSYQPFNISFVGIHAPLDGVNDLREIYHRLYEDNYLYRICKMYMLLTSSKLLIHKETAFVKEDLDKIPFPEDEKLLELSNDEKIIQHDVLNHYIHLGKSINLRSAGNIFVKDVSAGNLKSFGETFCSALNRVYANNEKSWQAGNPFDNGLFTIFPFGFGENNNFSLTINTLSDNIIKELISEKLSNSGAIFRRVIRIYKHTNGFDCIIFIKPNKMRYWLNSIALRDVDDTFNDFKQAGY